MSELMAKILGAVATAGLMICALAVAGAINTGIEAWRDRDE